MKLSSPDFDKDIPKRFTCDGENIPPTLEVSDMPENAKTLALIVDDPDGHDWVHWIMWNIPPASPLRSGIQGVNDFKEQGYGGPCPPSGTHRYFFRIYALDTILDLSPSAKKPDLEKAMHGHVIGKAELVGTFQH